MLEEYVEIPTSVANTSLVYLADQTSKAAIWTTNSDFLVYGTQRVKMIDSILPPQ